MKARRAIDASNQNCPIRNVLDRIGDRWSLLVLLNLDGGNALRFSVLKRTIGDISQRMLSQTLRRLEQDGLLVRHVAPTNPPSVSYSLTPLGASLMPKIHALADWANDNFGHIERARANFTPPAATAAL